MGDWIEKFEKPPRKKRWQHVRWKIYVTFEKRDAWVGAFFGEPEINEMTGNWWRKTYICLIPFFPIVIAQQVEPFHTRLYEYPHDGWERDIYEENDGSD